MGHRQFVSQRICIQPLEARMLMTVVGPDVSFGNGGKVNVPTQLAVGVLPGGKILSIGYVSLGEDGLDVIATRLNPDGSKDTTFGTGGAIHYGNHGGFPIIINGRYFIDGQGYTFDGVEAGSLGDAAAIDPL